VTSVRAVYAAILLGYGGLAVSFALPISDGLRWYFVICGLAALALDGVDGLLARRFGQESEFGARFDMETDAAIMLGLSLWVLLCAQTGSWVLVSGALRYMFIAGGWLWPVLAAPLPRRKRRQTICVAQTLVLILALAPPVLPGAAGLVCGAALALLTASFAADVAWLIANRVEADDREVVI
jgi:phosphatidylglycerophosphate synthase